jgi:hypothetical protein
MLTPYMNTTDKCLRFFYRILGDDDLLDGFIRVTAQDEDLHEVVLSSHRAPFYRLGQWTPAYVVLPTGIHRVEITGVRGNKSSGLALDDVEVHLCSHFEGQ